MIILILIIIIIIMINVLIWNNSFSKHIIRVITLDYLFPFCIRYSNFRSTPRQGRCIRLRSSYQGQWEDSICTDQRVHICQRPKGNLSWKKLVNVMEKQGAIFLMTDVQQGNNITLSKQLTKQVVISQK